MRRAEIVVGGELGGLAAGGCAGGEAAREDELAVAVGVVVPHEDVEVIDVAVACDVLEGVVRRAVAVVVARAGRDAGGLGRVVDAEAVVTVDVVAGDAGEEIAELGVERRVEPVEITLDDERVAGGRVDLGEGGADRALDVDAAPDHDLGGADDGVLVALGEAEVTVDGAGDGR